MKIVFDKQGKEMETQAEKENIKIKLTAQDREAIIEALRKFGLTPNLQKLVEVLLKASDGQIKFNASYKKLSEILHGRIFFLCKFEDQARMKRNAKARIKYQLERLNEWQNWVGIRIITLTKIGERKRLDNGRFQYLDSEFEFDLLKELAEQIKIYPKADFADNLETVLEMLAVKFRAIEKTNLVNSRWQAKRDEKTVITKFEKFCAERIEAGDKNLFAAKKLLDTLEIIKDKMCEEDQEKKEAQKLLERRKALEKNLIALEK